MYKLVTEGTVDELIFEMGERKKQLSQAVLSDERHGKGVKSPSGKSGVAGQDESEENAISKMLQKALAQRAQVAVATTTEERMGPIVISPDMEE